MRLEVNGSTKSDPKAADVGNAIRKRPANRDWLIRLVRSETESIEAQWTAQDNFRLAYTSGHVLFDGSRQVGYEELNEIFSAYLSGDAGWRERLAWQERGGRPLNSSADLLAWMRAFAPVGAVAVSLAIGWYLLPAVSDFVSRQMSAGIRLPAAIDSTPARIVLGFFAACVALFFVAVLVKTYEVRRAASWRKTTGKVVVSKPSFRIAKGFEGELPRNERFADVVYEYTVAGAVHRAGRISFAEKTPDAEVDQILARYPRGKIVEVFYDPKQPDDAVLERDFEGGLLRGCLSLLAIGIVGVGVLLIAMAYAPALIRTVFPNAIVPMVGMFSVAGTFMLLISVSFLKLVFTARSWPRTTGTIVLSRVHAFAGKEGRQQYMPVVEYKYSVGGKSYASRSIEFDSEVGGSESFAAGIAARYPAGKVVKVVYDPSNPGQAALEIKSGLGWCLLLAALAMLVLAAWATGTFTDGPILKVAR